MTGANAGKKLNFKPFSQLFTWMRPERPKDADTVRNLRLGVGAVGTLLPVTLILGNLIVGDKTIIPSSMSGSYYTSTRNLFVGSLCALGVFLIGYRGDTRPQDLYTSLAGVCALLVAFFPTAPPPPPKCPPPPKNWAPPPKCPPPPTEPAWINYLHLSAAAVLILTLGLFCLVSFTQFSKPGKTQSKSMADRLRACVRGFTAWMNSARNSLKQPGQSTLYLICGALVLVSELGAAATVIWPPGWPLLYLFEAVAVFAFGSAWLAEPVKMIWPKVRKIWARSTQDQKVVSPIGD